MDIKWQDPPPHPGATGRPNTTIWDPIAAELKKHPGRWALIQEGITSPSNGAEQCRRLGLKRRTHRRPGGKFDIYVKWEGKP